MGYRSNVKILMGAKAFDTLKTRCEASENESVRAMVQRPSSLTIDEEDQSVLIGWRSYKWDKWYKQVAVVEQILTELDRWVQNDPEDYPLEDYYYKRIRIGEDNDVDERTNDEDEEYTCDFYVEFTFSL